MKDFDAYSNRPYFYKGVGMKDWRDWTWQEKNSIRNTTQLKIVFKNFPEGELKKAGEWQKRGFRFLITPYVLSLVARDRLGNPMNIDPVWKQIFPVFAKSGFNDERPDEYDPGRENWEVSSEMFTSIGQHKYDNRAIICVSDCCLGYCMYCFRSLQSVNKNAVRGGMSRWRETMEAIRKRSQVEEVILSGGDPLIYKNEIIETLLRDLRRIKTIKAIRIHTRAWTHNPFRIDKGFCRLLKKYEVTGLGVHVVHPREIGADFLRVVNRVRESGARTQLLADIPLIKGINDNVKVMREILMRMYLAGVKPYYLSHNMPNIPAAGEQRTSVKKGLQIMNALKRRISNPAMPEYIIIHRTGKKTVPECPKGASDFLYEKDKNANPIIRFKNWKGQWQTYPDGVD